MLKELPDVDSFKGDLAKLLGGALVLANIETCFGQSHQGVKPFLCYVLCTEVKDLLVDGVEALLEPAFELWPQQNQ